MRRTSSAASASRSPQRLSRDRGRPRGAAALLHRRAVQLPRHALRLRRRVIRPGYVQPGGPPLWVAAMSEAGALRAARFGAPPAAAGTARRRSLEPWRRRWRRRPRPDVFRVGIIRACLVTDDPERDWPAVRAAERYRGELYTRFFAEAGRPSPSRAKGRGSRRRGSSGTSSIACGALGLHRRARDHRLVTWAVPPGLHPERMNASLERFAREWSRGCARPSSRTGRAAPRLTPPGLDRAVALITEPGPGVSSPRRPRARDASYRDRPQPGGRRHHPLRHMAGH